MRFFCLIFLLSISAIAQKVQTRIQDFQANPDQGGKRIFIKGDYSNPTGGGIMDVSRPHVETFTTEGKVDAIIDATQCFFDQTKTHDVWSEKDLSMRTANGSIALKGVGFRWTLATSQLSISNHVEATLRRQALTQASSSPSTNQDNLSITSSRMTYSGSVVVFTGNVRVVDRQGEVRCQYLKATFDESKTNTLQEIDAFDDVVLIQDETEARGKRAVYTHASGLLRLTEKTKWKMADREGESELLILDRTNKTVRAETSVRMSFPATLLATNAPDAKVPETKTTNRVTIAADTFDFAPTNTITHGPIAIFNGNVRATDPQADLNCELLTIFFNRSNKVVRAIADRAVRVGRPNTEVHGERAVFENEEITLTGKPNWTHDKQTGSSDILILNPHTREIRATNVRMNIPFSSRTNLLASTNLQTKIDTNILVVTATYFTNKDNTAIFADKVRAIEPNSQIDANHVSVDFKTNHVERITAKGDVILTQDKSQATGQAAIYEAKTQSTWLLGNPKLTTEDSEIIAREFIRTERNFKPIPPFQITIKQKGTNGFAAPF